MLRLLAGFLTIITLLLAVFLGLTLTGIDLGFARSQLEFAGTKILGRGIHLSGPILLKTGHTTSITISDVSIESATWEGPVPLLDLAELTIEVQTASLFSSQIRLEYVGITGLALDLRESLEEGPNWTLTSAEEAPEQNELEEAQGLPVVLAAMSVSNVQVDYYNEKTDEAALFKLASLQQSQGEDGRLTLAGSGHFGGQAWTLEGQFSSLDTLIEGRNISHQFEVEMGDFSLRGQGLIPELDNPKDLTFDLAVHGRITEAMSTLSPLLEAGGRLDVDLAVKDIEPGIAWLGTVLLDDIQITLKGHADDPLEYDGAAITIAATGSDLARLVQALGLGPLPSRTFTLDGTVVRNGKDLDIHEVVFVSGPDSIRIDGTLTNFPGTHDSTLNVQASGPDFSLFQRMLLIPGTIRTPYRFTAELIDRDEILEFARAELLIGGHRVAISGPIGTFPHYAGSDFNVAVAGPRVSEIGELLGLSGLPPDSYAAEGGVAIHTDQRLVLSNFAATVGPLQLGLDGELGIQPQIEILTMDIGMQTASMAELGSLLEVDGFEAVPAELRAEISGPLDALSITNVRATLAGARLRSNGKIALTESGVSGSMGMQLDLPDLSEIHSAFAIPGIVGGPYQLEFQQNWDEEGLTIEVERLTGVGLKGEFFASIGPDFSLTGATLNGEIQLDSPAKNFPSVASYHPPGGAIVVKISSSVRDENVQIALRAKAEEGGELAISLTSPLSGENQQTRIGIGGKGNDLAVFGHYDGLPSTPMPFDLSVNTVLNDDTIRVVIEGSEIGGSRIEGDLLLVPGPIPRLEANIAIPHANLSEWLDSAASGETAARDESATSDKSGRLIPNTVIPVEMLTKLNFDIKLETGPLGLPDPLFSDQSLIDRLSLVAVLEGEELQVNVKELLGSRGVTSGTASVSGADGVALAGIKVKVVDFPLGIIASTDSIDKLPMHSLDASFTSRGVTVRQLAENLSGRLLLEGGPGVVDDAGLNLAMGSFTEQLLGALLPTVEENPDIQIECTVLALNATDGLLNLQPGFVMRTADIDLSAGGTVNLKNESLTIRFHNQARKGLGISAAGLVNPYVQIEGTLAKPEIGLDTVGAAISGTAAVMTGGLSILGEKFYERFVSTTKPCQEAVKRL